MFEDAVDSFEETADIHGRRGQSMRPSQIAVLPAPD